MWASTHNRTLQQKMRAVVSALSSCQNKIGSGYLSAFPSEFFDRFEALEDVWAPYYTIHKVTVHCYRGLYLFTLVSFDHSIVVPTLEQILAGLLDQYTLAGSDEALRMMKWMVDYLYDRVQNVIKKYTIERHWMSLNEETGGMNDVLYKL